MKSIEYKGETAMNMDNIMIRKFFKDMWKRNGKMAIQSYIVSATAKEIFMQKRVSGSDL